METVRALTPNQWAIISWDLTVWATAVERRSADAAVLIVGHPQPGRHTIPLLYFNLHLFHRSVIDQARYVIVLTSIPSSYYVRTSSSYAFLAVGKPTYRCFTATCWTWVWNKTRVWQGKKY